MELQPVYLLNSPYNISVPSLNARGAWSSSTSYNIYDVVSYHGSAYIATGSSVNQQPDTQTSYWSLLTQGYANQGVWSSSTTYTIGDTVTYGGSTYSSIVTNNINKQPDISVSYWVLIAVGYPTTDSPFIFAYTASGQTITSSGYPNWTTLNLDSSDSSTFGSTRGGSFAPTFNSSTDTITVNQSGLYSITSSIATATAGQAIWSRLMIGGSSPSAVFYASAGPSVASGTATFYPTSSQVSITKYLVSGATIYTTVAIPQTGSITIKSITGNVVYTYLSAAWVGP